MAPRQIVAAVLVVLVLLLAANHFRKRALERRRAEQPPAEGEFVLVCPSFGHGGAIPPEYTADGRNVSPPLVWDNVPDGTMTFALVVEDPDAPNRTFTHWMLCEIPGKLRELPEGVPSGETTAFGAQGVNDFRETAYGGPNPPHGQEHRYFFRLYALSTTLDMAGAYTKQQLRAAMAGSILAETALMGRYRPAAGR
ncbi:MAG: YbhB/YbcL family Raf kinase inhibitor-like protein [Candidatus Brocadiaceae bacterium]|nr:YbhB/YbcL family Raf kinase inhibitor-like protein [Candidatus Brocadiaceae bacterium]